MRDSQTESLSSFIDDLFNVFITVKPGAMISVESDMAMRLDMTDVINTFATSKGRKLVVTEVSCSCKYSLINLKLRQFG